MWHICGDSCYQRPSLLCTKLLDVDGRMFIWIRNVDLTCYSTFLRCGLLCRWRTALGPRLPSHADRLCGSCSPIFPRPGVYLMCGNQSTGGLFNLYPETNSHRWEQLVVWIEAPEAGLSNFGPRGPLYVFLLTPPPSPPAGHGGVFHLRMD